MAEKLSLLTTNLNVYRHPRHVPGYKGYTPRIKFTYGDAYGNTTARWFNDYRWETLNNSRERKGRGGDKDIPFPTYYTNNPDHVIGARTRSHERWLADPKYRLLNGHDRDEDIKDFDRTAQHHREQYRDHTGTIYPVGIFVLPNIYHDTKPMRFPAAPRTLDQRKAVAFANQVYRRMKTEPLAKTNIEERRIRDVFFERR